MRYSILACAKKGVVRASSQFAENDIIKTFSLRASRRYAPGSLLSAYLHPATPYPVRVIARFPVPFIFCALFFSLPPSRNPDPGPYSRLFSPLPTAVRALHFYREKDSALYSFVDSRRNVPTHATICALDARYFEK